jgi:hypothetical protein
MRPVISKRPRRPCFSDRAILPGGDPGGVAGSSCVSAAKRNFGAHLAGSAFAVRRGFAHVLLLCPDNPTCLRSARPAQVRVVFRLFRDNLGRLLLRHDRAYARTGRCRETRARCGVHWLKHDPLGSVEDPARDPGDVRARSRARGAARGALGLARSVGDDDLDRVVVDLLGDTAPAVEELPEVGAESWIGESNAHGEESRLASSPVRGPRLTAEGCPARPFRTSTSVTVRKLWPFGGGTTETSAGRRRVAPASAVGPGRGYFPRAVFFFGFGFGVLPVLPGAASFFGLFGDTGSLLPWVGIRSEAPSRPAGPPARRYRSASPPCQSTEPSRPRPETAIVNGCRKRARPAKVARRCVPASLSRATAAPRLSQQTTRQEKGSAAANQATPN